MLLRWKHSSKHTYVCTRTSLANTLYLYFYSIQLVHTPWSWLWFWSVFPGQLPAQRWRLPGPSSLAPHHKTPHRTEWCWWPRNTDLQKCLWYNLVTLDCCSCSCCYSKKCLFLRDVYYWQLVWSNCDDRKSTFLCAPLWWLCCVQLAATTCIY